MSRVTSGQTARDDGLLCCDVGHERYAFRGGDVRHVERAECMRADRSDGRVGTLTLGARHVPVYALADVLGRPASDRQLAVHDGHIAVTGDRHAMAGWLVDRIARAPQPAPGDVAPLPPLVGAPATSWFEGIVRLSDDASVLLLAPDRLTSPIAAVDNRDAGIVFERPRPIAAGEPEPVAVVFSTSVFPASAARRYALSGRQVAAVVQPAAPIPVPGCSGYVLGVTWWRGAVVPVVDFRDPADRGGAHRRRLIVQCGPRRHGSLVAFSIDSEVIMCRPAADHRRLPAVSCPPFASGVFDINGDAVALLDLDALLTGPLHAVPA